MNGESVEHVLGSIRLGYLAKYAAGSLKCVKFLSTQPDP